MMNKRVMIFQIFLSIIFFFPSLTISLNDQSTLIWGRDRQSGFAFINKNTHDSSSQNKGESSQQDSTQSLIETSELMTQLLSSTTPDISSNHPPRVIIIGGPASGKGTQCEYVASKYGVIHLSTGEMLREAVRRKDSEIGRIAKHYMDLGELVPDEAMIKIVSARLEQEDCQKHGWLLDGFPRTKAQAEHFSQMGIEADVTIVLNVPDNELIDRVIGRRIDSVTGKIYHLKYRPPPSDVGEDRLVQRSDDTVEKMKLRLKNFHEHLSLIRRFMDDSTFIVEVDGLGSPELIAEKIAAAIDSKIGHCSKVIA